MSDPLPRWTAALERRVLPNGLTCLVQPDPAAPAVAVVTHVKAGFFDEPDQWQGISHVLEHMFFKGTPTRGVGRVAAETKALGGYLNASTSYDATSYYVVLPAERFAQALEIQADALRNAALDPDELRRELRVIIEEAKRKLDTPSAVAHETLHAVLFDRHRIRRWRIGTEEMLATFTRDDVAGYYQSRYVPGRVILAVVGAVDPARVLDAVERLYRDWPAQPGAVDPSPEEPWHPEVRARTLRGDLKQAELALGWRGVPSLHPHAAPLDLAAVILGSGRGAWLYRALRRTGLVTSIGAYHYSPTEVGVFSVAADLAPDRVRDALAGIARQVAALRARGPSTGNLERARTLLTTQWARRLESVEGRASAFAAAEALGGFELIDREYADLLAVTEEQVRDAARRYLAPEGVGAVLYLPHGQGDDLDPGRLAAEFAGPSAAEAFNGGRLSVGQAAAAAAPAGRTRAGVVHVALPGADLLLQRKAGVPLVSLGGYRRRRAVERKATAGLGALAVRSAVRGAGSWNADQLADLVEGLGGTLGAAVTADWFGFGLSVLEAHLGVAAQVLAAVLGQPHHDPEEIARERQTLAEEVAQTADDMFRYPVELALAAAFGEGRYGIPVKGTPESVASLTAELVPPWHAGELAAGRTTVVAVGDLDPERAADLLAGVFDGRATAPDEEVEPVAPSEVAAGARAELREKSQTALAMLFPGPRRTDPSRYPAMVLAAIASGLGGRIFHALRDRRSLAYTVLLSSWQRRGAGALLAYVATSPEREAEAREAMLSELQRFGAEPVTEEELSQAVNYLAGQTAVQRQTGGAIAAEILDAWLMGDDLDELADPAAPFRRVTREAVLEVAARSFTGGRHAEGVVRGQAAD